MTCQRYADAETAERYVSGQMDEAEQTTFEEHYFGCDACFALVQRLQDVRTVLAGQPRTVAAATATTSGAAASSPAAPTPATPAPVTVVPFSRAPRRQVVWWGLAAAATVILAVGIWRSTQSGAALPDTPQQARQETPVTPPPATPAPSQPTQSATPSSVTPAPVTPAPVRPAPERPAPERPAPERPAPETRETVLARLAAIAPPAFVAMQVRGESAESAPFADAMRPYVARDYRAAAEALRTVVQAQPSRTPAWFFLGVSELMNKRPTAARYAFDRVMASQVAPYADEAHFYAAKAAIADGDVDAARRELRVAVEREAGPAGEAQDLLTKLQSLPERSHAR